MSSSPAQGGECFQGEYPPPDFQPSEVVEVLIEGLRDEEKVIKQPRTYQE